jgi:hypothetical protein
MLKMLLSLTMAALLAAAGATWAQETQVTAKILLQESPLAGFQFHEGKQLWRELRVGDALQLVREADNPHDARAVRVEWRGHLLGYVPRADNEAVARLLDRGTRLEARVVRLRESRNPWRRVLFEVYVDSLR